MDRALMCAEELLVNVSAAIKSRLKITMVPLIQLEFNPQATRVTNQLESIFMVPHLAIKMVCLLSTVELME